MHLFTSSMYIYNASDSTCCLLFPSSLTGKALAWYVHLPPRSISSFNDLGEKFTKNFLAQAIFIPTSDFLFSVQQKPHEFVRDYTTQFNQVAEEIPDLSEKKFIQAYRYELCNTTFSRKLVTKEPADVNTLLLRIKTFIQGGDYVKRKRELENEVKETQIPKRTKPRDATTRVSVQDRLSPRRIESSHFDYTPLRLPRGEIIQKVESLGVLRPPVKMLSSPDKRNRAKFYQFHQDYGHDTI